MSVRGAPLPRYRQIYEVLLQQLQSRELLPGTRLSPDRALMEQFQVSRLTVSKAVAQLAREGYLVRRPGSGTYVTDPSSGRRDAARRVALLVPFTQDMFISRLIKSLSRELYERECVVHFHDYNGDDAQEAQHLERIAEQDVQGLIAFPKSLVHNRRMYAEFVAAGRAVVCIDRYFPDLPIPAITTDNHWGACRAVQILLSQGHERIAYLYPEEPPSTALIDRRLGYERALLEAGCELDPLLIRQSGLVTFRQHPYAPDEPPTPCEAILTEWLSSPAPPTAIFCTNDFMLQCCILTLRRIGRRVPEHVSLAGFCDMQDWLAHVPEPFLGLRQRTDEIGLQTVELLSEILESSADSLDPAGPLDSREPSILRVRPEIWFHPT